MDKNDLVCTLCGVSAEEKPVKGYAFKHLCDKGHGNEWLTGGVVLCKECQGHIYDVIKFAIEETGKKMPISEK